MPSGYAAHCASWRGWRDEFSRSGTCHGVNLPLAGKGWSCRKHHSRLSAAVFTRVWNARYCPLDCLPDPARCGHATDLPMILHHTRPTPTPLRVLVVDDEPSIRTTVSMMLTLEGHQVQTAADGDDWPCGWPLSSCRMRTRTDLHMPRLDGLALLAAVRGNPALAHTRVILLTGESPAELAVRAGPQADAQLTKPFTRVQLLEALLPKSC